MNIVLIGSSEELSKNIIFEKIYRDDCLYFFRLLKSEIELNNWNINAIGELKENEYRDIDVVILYRIDKNIGKLLSIVKRNPQVRIIHIMHEPPVICPMHSEKIVERLPFDIQLALNDDLVDETRTVKKICYGITPALPNKLPQVEYDEKKFIATIAGAKKSKIKYELYSERVDTIKYFAKKVESFDLYGVGWDSWNDGTIDKVYKGVVDNKIEVLKNYKFTLCYENTCGYRGYITEKIFDCFAARTVPIYYGAPNVEEYIPKECYIDYREFKSKEELYQFLVNMKEEEYNVYLNAALIYIKSERYQDQTASGYVKTLMDSLESLKNKTRERNVKIARMQLMLGVLRNLRFYLKHFSATKRYVFELLAYKI